MDTNDRRWWQPQFQPVLLPDPMADENWVSWLLSAVLFVLEKWCYYDQFKLFMNTQLCLMYLSIMFWNFLWTLRRVWCICPSYFAHWLWHPQSCAIYIAHALSVDFLTFEPHFGGCTLYPEAPCSLENMLLSVLLLLPRIIQTGEAALGDIANCFSPRLFTYSLFCLCYKWRTLDWLSMQSCCLPLSRSLAFSPLVARGRHWINAQCSPSSFFSQLLPCALYLLTHRVTGHSDFCHVLRDICPALKLTPLFC